MTYHPYRDRPSYAYWRDAMTAPSAADVDPVVEVPFQIGRTDAVATAGSCFAQHISRRLQQQRFNFLITEKMHPFAPSGMAERHNYGVFTARYGNIYTARQLLQLAQRALGEFSPQDSCWTAPGNRVADPFRPQVQPGFFVNAAECAGDRQTHLAAVREAFQSLDVFVFTLGLTECWVSKADGAAYPLCPGVAAGTFDPGQHAFVNFGVDEVVADTVAFIDRLRSVNAKARVILTVSPVPLVATAEDRHVLVSTVYSKSVLRVACDLICKQRKDVAYFPSFEIVTGPHAHYFAADLRSVTDRGVDHVMKLFFRHFAAGETIKLDTQSPAPPAEETEAEQDAAEMTAAADLVCEELMLDRPR